MYRIVTENFAKNLVLQVLRSKKSQYCAKAQNSTKDWTIEKKKIFGPSKKGKGGEAQAHQGS